MFLRYVFLYVDIKLMSSKCELVLQQLNLVENKVMQLYDFCIKVHNQLRCL